MDDRRAALLLAVLTLAGAGVRLALAPSTAAAPGDLRLVGRDTPPPGPRGLSATARTAARLARPLLDRKSTRLNSSHSQISYAVFCLKKKKITHYDTLTFFLFVINGPLLLFLSDIFNSFVADFFLSTTLSIYVSVANVYHFTVSRLIN